MVYRSALFWSKFVQVGVETPRRDGEEQEFLSFTPTSKCIRLKQLITERARQPADRTSTTCSPGFLV